MRMTYRVLSLLVMLALALPVVAAPATSFAQSAGDDQYVDPFQDDNSGGGGNGGNQGNSGNQGNNTPSDQQSVAQAPADTSGAAGTTATESAQGDSLPRTGLDMAPLVAIGVLLLGGGFALRRAWPRPH
jgi:LPXTG-motif cell wall-anchored protein